MGLTQDVANFVLKTRYRDIPREVMRLAQGFVLDGLGGGIGRLNRRVLAHRTVAPPSHGR